MDTRIPDDIAAFGVAARRRFDALGAVRFALAAETDDAARGRAGAALAEVGAWDVDPRTGGDDLLAAAVLCRAAGAVALPFPVVEQLLAVGDARLALIDPDRPWVDHGDLGGEWLGSDLDGRLHRLTTAPRRRAKLGPFVTRATAAPASGEIPRDDVAIHLVLGAWRIVGALETALSLVADHVVVRTQFGKPLSEFQAVRFTIADAAVALRGLDELAKFTLWRLTTATGPARWADAVALRLHADEVARDVLRCSHQMLGAIGFCDEHDVSVLDRHLQPLLRLPHAAEALAERLVPAVGEGLFESLFTAAPA
jgi:hypothetical protein